VIFDFENKKVKMIVQGFGHSRNDGKVDQIQIVKDVKEYKASVDENGNLILPAEIVKKLGLDIGADLRITAEKDRIEIFPNIHSLSRVYIEPTSLCNLTCQTCVRNTWKEQMGEMDINVFNMLIEQLKEFPHLQSVMFGGVGEPTAHRDILYMIGRVNSLGIKTEMVTNGTLLDETMIEGLIENKLDALWVSFDGADEKVFENIREGASYNSVVNNLRALKHLNKKSRHKIKVGIAFVVMVKNVDDLPNLDKLAGIVGAEMISISNVLPYSKEMADQMLCSLSIADIPDPISISLPLIDKTGLTKEPLYKLMWSNNNVSILTNRIGTETSKCRFIRDRCTFIRWDGIVSPCMGLLHSYTTYLNGDRAGRDITSYSPGSIDSDSLKRIWDSEEYFNFRERVDKFDFSPCYRCGGCSSSRKNQEDCFGNTFPTCGGCLWAQGVIQCP